MPAYFSIDIECDRNKLYSNYVADFFSALERCGAKWKSGARDSEGFSRKEQVQIDQRILEGNNYPHKYYQSYFQFCKFSETRGYWWPYRNTINYHLIIPEDDLVFWDQFSRDGDIPKHYDAMRDIERLCLAIWEQWDCLVIQTAWEASDLPPDYEWLVRAKGKPQTLPFSIIPRGLYNDDWEYEVTEIGNNGLLLRNDDGWEPM